MENKIEDKMENRMRILGALLAIFVVTIIASLVLTITAKYALLWIFGITISKETFQILLVVFFLTSSTRLGKSNGLK